MIIAIDGPAGTGKSTIASLVAKKLNITNLNSGSFYRALTMAILDNNIDYKDQALAADFATIFASVVLPTPGGPQRMNEVRFPLSIIFRSTQPCPTRCLCPT